MVSSQIEETYSQGSGEKDGCESLRAGLLRSEGEGPIIVGVANGGVEGTTRGGLGSGSGWPAAVVIGSRSGDDAAPDTCYEAALSGKGSAGNQWRQLQLPRASRK